MKDLIVRASAGNPGAMSVLMMILKQSQSLVAVAAHHLLDTKTPSYQLWDLYSRANDSNIDKTMADVFQWVGDPGKQTISEMFEGVQP